MKRHALLAAALGAPLLVGCAAIGDSFRGESDLANRVRQELALDPTLSASSLIVTERDGEIVVGGFVQNPEDLDTIRETAESVAGVGGIRNNVVLRPDG